MERTAILGDIHADYDRMLEHVGDIDPSVPLVVAGDYFDRWDQGLEVIRWLMARPNTTCILGNHDVLMLGVLEEVWRGQEGRAVETWIWNGGRRADMNRLQHDPEAIDWIRSLPAMAMLDGILVQHCDSPVYLNYGGSVDEVNAAIRRRIDSRDPEVLYTVFAHLCRRRQFYNPDLLREYLQAFEASALVHGHTPHTQPQPISLFNGAITNVDGAMSRGFGPERRGFVYWVGDVDGAAGAPRAAQGG